MAKCKNKGELTVLIEELFEHVMNVADKNGISAFVYTQLSDVEDETNGLITYDRRVVKIAPVEVKGIVGFVNKDYVLNKVNAKSATITGKDQITVTFAKEVKAVAYFYDTEDSYGDTINLERHIKPLAQACLRYAFGTVRYYTTTHT